MAYIKRGEAKTVPVRVKFNDMDVFPLGNVDEIAFKLGDSVRKTWPDAVRYDNANGRFLLTLPLRVRPTPQRSPRLELSRSSAQSPSRWVVWISPRRLCPVVPLALPR